MVVSEFQVALACSWSMEIDRGVQIGETPEGLRAVGYLKEGKVIGDRISGTVMAGAADWTVMRKDGILRPNVKLIITTPDEAKILVEYEGFVDMGPDGYETRLHGRRPGVLHPRTLVRMLTASPAYAWVNRSPFIGIGRLDLQALPGVISYDIYEITSPQYGDGG